MSFSLVGVYHFHALSDLLLSSIKALAGDLETANDSFVIMILILDSSLRNCENRFQLFKVTAYDERAPSRRPYTFAPGNPTSTRLLFKLPSPPVGHHVGYPVEIH